MKLSQFAIKFYSKLNDSTIDAIKNNFPEIQKYYIKSKMNTLFIIFI
jgi:hypothetical protein